ncbi:MAG: inorganic diphosphatase [Candidatus Kaiserbacteria bacterium]|nr:inorganic diphosphatase [Candidatus Kaiserbacteria bacterium]
MSLWHDIDPGDSGGVMHAIIEIPRGSKNKYEIDKDTGIIALDRAMHTAQDYPVDYGFVPQTLWDDNDALDVCILTTYPLHPGILVPFRPVGILHMNDSGESDDKLLGVPADDPRFDEVQDLKDVNTHTIKEIQHFFETYKQLQDKAVTLTGSGGAKEAREAFDRARAMYQEKFPQKGS